MTSRPGLAAQAELLGALDGLAAGGDAELAVDRHRLGLDRVLGHDTAAGRSRGRSGGWAAAAAAAARRWSATRPPRPRRGCVSSLDHSSSTWAGRMPRSGRRRRIVAGLAQHHPGAGGVVQGQAGPAQLQQGLDSEIRQGVGEQRPQASGPRQLLLGAWHVALVHGHPGRHGVDQGAGDIAVQLPGPNHPLGLLGQGGGLRASPGGASPPASARPGRSRPRAAHRLRWRPRRRGPGSGRPGRPDRPAGSRSPPAAGRWAATGCPGRARPGRPGCRPASGPRRRGTTAPAAAPDSSGRCCRPAASRRPAPVRLRRPSARPRPAHRPGPAARPRARPPAGSVRAGPGPRTSRTSGGWCRPVRRRRRAGPASRPAARPGRCPRRPGRGRSRSPAARWPHTRTAALACSSGTSSGSRRSSSARSSSWNRWW